MYIYAIFAANFYKYKKIMKFTLDIEQFVRDEISRQLRERENTFSNECDSQICAGQRALAERLHVSLITVCRWQKEGRLDGCFTRVGRKIIYDLAKIEKLYKKS